MSWVRIGFLFAVGAWVALASCGAPFKPQTSACDASPDCNASGGGEGGTTNGGSDGDAAGNAGLGGASGASGNPECGDGRVSGAEQCDDGNTQTGDGCSTSCQLEMGFQCDDSEPTRCAEKCGDGSRVGAEALAGGCDDGGTKDGDGCSSACKVEPTWSCAGEPSVCQSGCGDGVIGGSETCDDANSRPNDGCFACATEAGWTCAGEPSTCSDLNECAANGNDCAAAATCMNTPGSFTCTCNDGYSGNGRTCAAICGDGKVVAGEECDDGGKVSGDGCSSSCKPEDNWSCSGSPSVCVQPSCVGLAASCGPNGSSNCCAAGVVPGGTFNRGNDAARPATVTSFRLESYEVTVGRFRKFVAAYRAGFRPPAGSGKNPNDSTDGGWDSTWNSNLPGDLPTALKCNSGFQTWTDSPGQNESRPINCPTWYESLAFCIWDGGRLPTEAEWNYAAAGGSEQRQYPWSSPPSSTTISAAYASYACLVDGSAGGACAPSDIINVGSKPNGAGRWGQSDLAGNVWEWTIDSDGQYPVPCKDCANRAAAAMKIMRGRSFYDDAANLLTSNRSAFAATERNNAIGLRCARNP